MNEIRIDGVFQQIDQ